MMKKTVKIDGVEYAEEACDRCDSKGVKRDVTMVDYVHGDGSGMVRCPKCEGAGIVRTLTKAGHHELWLRFQARRAAK